MRKKLKKFENFFSFCVFFVFRSYNSSEQGEEMIERRFVELPTGGPIKSSKRLEKMKTPKTKGE